MTGLQEIYRRGLAHLDERSQQAFGVSFVDAPPPAQDLLLSDQSDGDLQTFVGAALSNTLEAVYGPPEYGGNRNLVGWSYTRWAGDSQPRGYADSVVSSPDPPDVPLDAKLAATFDRFLPVLAGRPAPRQAFWLGRRGFLNR